MHPMLKELFIDSDANDLAAEQDQRRRARRSRRARPAMTAYDVQPWMGERSLPLWLPMPEYAGFSSRDNSAAKAAGLTTRPLAETLADTLTWELGRNLHRPRRAGLSDHDERRLLQALTAA